MTYFLKNGETYRVASEQAVDMTQHLPGGNYAVAQDITGAYFLTKIDSFEIPDRLYGNTLRHTDRVINTFNSRPATTGVLLNGEKGSGKTLLAKNICSVLAAKDVPTIVVNRPIVDEGFFKLLQDIIQPCVLLFDEFEKVYGENEEQEKILTLLDGVFSSKKLVLFTCNDKWRINTHMRNRPGRIFYLLDFKGLDNGFIVEYCQEKLNNKEHIESICSIANLFSEFNFDLLKALVEEMNRYNETPVQALEMLNAKPEYDGGSNYEVKIVHDGKEVKTEALSPSEYRGNPLNSNGVRVGFDPSINAGKEDDEGDDWVQLVFTPENIIKVNAVEGKFIFQNKGSVLTLTKIKASEGTSYFNWL